ncbi:MAG: hypothetical protein ABI359_12880 [Ginsengibacter sp.]
MKKLLWFPLNGKYIYFNSQQQVASPSLFADIILVVGKMENYLPGMAERLVQWHRRQMENGYICSRTKEINLNLKSW